MDITIENLQVKVEVTKKLNELMEKAIKACLDVENFSIPCEVNVMLVDNDRIKQINSEYRNMDKPTDVLSFPIVDMYEGKINSDEGDYNLDDDVMILGDIIISLEKAKEQSVEYGHSFERELAFLLTHGVFHLLGYDHDTEEREKIMFQKQDAVLGMLNLER
jgi:probable rRNA maturation factor